MLSFGIFEILLSFILVLTPVVFIHELGHFWVARKTGVVVDVFSVGFGREIFGWTDSHGTRWRFAWIPLGGYVKMRGDENAAGGSSATSNSKVPSSTPDSSVPRNETMDTLRIESVDGSLSVSVESSETE